MEDRRVLQVAAMLGVPFDQTTSLRLLEVLINKYASGIGVPEQRWDPTFNAMEEAQLLLDWIECQPPRKREALRRRLGTGGAGLYCDWLEVIVPLDGERQRCDWSGKLAS